ncbi:sugar transferase [Glaciecola sp. 1036]|uniref:sugar transferase n=1 Tax=Alteromonadaceae TaxID=72275 RepID=UPI003CFC85A7
MNGKAMIGAENTMQDCVVDTARKNINSYSGNGSEVALEKTIGKAGVFEGRNISTQKEAEQAFPYPIEKPSLALRLIEITVALIALTIGLPLMLFVAIVIVLDSRGPVLFVQKRVSAGTKLFRFTKFRTMYVDARERFPEWYAYKYDDKELQDLYFKVKEDPRITRQGRWLRKSTLDELPNFWCLLTGEMALVGPRPEIPEMLPYYKGEMLKKFTVRPGITGLAQVSGRGRLGFYETVDLDVEYVEKRSLMFDIKIVLLTVKGVIFRHGAF